MQQVKFPIARLHSPEFSLLAPSSEQVMPSVELGVVANRSLNLEE
jgi:hypothetical protein